MGKWKNISDVEKDKKVKVIGKFHNAAAEFFVVYSVVGVSEIIFVTGDELDWEPGYIWRGGDQLVQPFYLDKEEKMLLEKVVKDAKA